MLADFVRYAALAARIEEVRTLAVPIQRAVGPGVLSGGRLTTSVEELIDSTAAEIQALVAELEAFSDATRLALDEG